MIVSLYRDRGKDEINCLQPAISHARNHQSVFKQLSQISLKWRDILMHKFAEKIRDVEITIIIHVCKYCFHVQRSREESGKRVEIPWRPTINKSLYPVRDSAAYCLTAVEHVIIRTQWILRALYTGEIDERLTDEMNEIKIPSRYKIQPGASGNSHFLVTKLKIWKTVTFDRYLTFNQSHTNRALTLT